MKWKRDRTDKNNFRYESDCGTYSIVKGSWKSKKYNLYRKEHLLVTTKTLKDAKDMARRDSIGQIIGN